MFKKILPIVSLLFSVGTANATVFNNHDSLYLSARAGSLGIGPELNYKFNKHFGIRGFFNTYNFSLSNVYKTNSSFNTTYEGTPVSGRLSGKYGGNVKLLNGGVFGDYYPFSKSAFRITSGFIINKNDMGVDGTYSATGIAQKDIIYHGQQINMSHPVNIDNAGYAKGHGFYSPVAPYVGIGFNSRLYHNVYINGDLGAMFQTYSRMNISATGEMTNYRGYEKSINTAQNKIRHYMNYAVPAYPVVMLGIGYRF